MTNEVLTPRPLGTHVLVRQVEPVKMVGGLIHLIDGAEEWPPHGTVVAVGPGVSADCPRPGERVLFARRANSSLAPDSRDIGQEESWQNLLMLEEEDLLAILGVAIDSATRR